MDNKFKCKRHELTVSVAEDLYYRWTDEDGTPMEHSAYYVRAEAPDGSRWTHVCAFFGHELGRAEALARAERLAHKVRLSCKSWRGPARNERWRVSAPCYGSMAYARNSRRMAAEESLLDNDFDAGSVREHEQPQAAGALMN